MAERENLDKMRIAFVVNDLSGGGAEKALLHFAGYLHRQNHSIKIFRLQEGNDAYPLPPGIETSTLKQSLDSTNLKKLASIFFSQPALFSGIHEWQPDLAVSFLPRANISLLKLSKKLRPIKTLVTEQVSTVDNYSGIRPASILMKSLIQNYYPQADLVVASSSGVADGLRTLGISPDKIEVVYNPVNLDEIRALAVQPVEIPLKTRPRIITIGRLVPQKDHETLLRSFKIARESVDAELVILGEGPLRSSLQKLAHNLNLENSVVFAGWHPNPFAWLKTADLFVLSSIFEGFGNVLIEAMACGLPVVSTDCRHGPSEILSQGEFGRLVPTGNANLLGKAMLEIIVNGDCREHFRNLSLLRAQAFDISVLGVKYEAILNGCLGT